MFLNLSMIPDCQEKVLTHVAKQDVKHVTIQGSSSDWRAMPNYTPWPQADFHAYTSFEINRGFNIKRLVDFDGANFQ